MTKNLFEKLYRYSYVATGIRKVVLFIRNNPGIVDTLRDIPFVDGLGLLLYIGILSYLWYEYIKQQHPVLYGTLLHAYRHYMICSRSFPLLFLFKD